MVFCLNYPDISFTSKNKTHNLGFSENVSLIKLFFIKFPNIVFSYLKLLIKHSFTVEYLTAFFSPKKILGFIKKKYLSLGFLIDQLFKPRQNQQRKLFGSILVGGQVALSEKQNQDLINMLLMPVYCFRQNKSGAKGKMKLETFPSRICFVLFK